MKWFRMLRRRRANRAWRGLSIEARVKRIADRLPEDVNLISTSIAGRPGTYALEYVDERDGLWVAPLGSPLPLPGAPLPKVWVAVR